MTIMEKLRDYNIALQKKHPLADLQVREIKNFRAVSHWMHYTPAGKDSLWEERIYSDPTASVFIVEGLFDLSDTDTEYKFYMSRAEAETYLQLRMELELEGRGFQPVEEFY